MYLSKLELHGFKSFADRTQVDFAPGVTVVVGPNGCGKSNIVDAVRWVIGEQRARILRSDKMDSVIFNGTSKRRSLGMSEVLLTIENTRGVLPTEYSEVTIGRRLFRSGESEYLLNGVQCRLKDITDLFMDTGMGAGAYSVIELKMIEEILSDNAQDRRHLFEEAAGITKYKIRRGQTLRKLKSTQADLDRVRDLTEELDKRVRSLERQAQKASRFQRYEKRLHELELTLAGLDYQKLSTEAATVKTEIVTISDAGSGLTAKLSNEEAGYEALRNDHITKERLVVDAQTKLADHVESLRASESDLRLGTERLSTISRDLTRLEEEKATEVGQRSTLIDRVSQLDTEIAEVQPAADQAEAELTDAKRLRDEAQLNQQRHQVMLHNLRLEERDALNSRVDRQRLIDRLSSRIEITEADLVEARKTLESIGTGGSDIDIRFAAAEKEHSASYQALENAKKELADAELKLESLNVDLESARLELRSAERAHDAAVAESSLLEGMLSSFDDLSESVQFLANESNWSSDDLLTVADVLSCDDSLRGAVDAALGDFASCIVVQTEREAHAAIQSLRSNEKGKATFLILDKLGDVTLPNSSSYDELGSVVRATESRYESLISLLFAGCYLVDALDDLKGDLPGRMFTRNGEWITPEGYLHAGSESATRNPASARLGRREQLEALRERLTQTESVVVKAEAIQRGILSVLGELPLGELKSTLRQTRTTHSELERALQRVSYEKETQQQRRQEIEARLVQLTSQKSNAEAQLADAETQLKGFTIKVADLQNKRADAEAAFTGIEEASREAFSLFNEANITAVQTRNRLDNLKKEHLRTKDDLQRLIRRAEERHGAVQRLQEQQIELDKRCDELQVTIRSLQEARSELETDVTGAKEVLMETKVAISEMESRLRELRRDRESAMKEEADRATRQATIETKLETLVASILEDFEIDLHTYEFEVEENFDRNEAREEVTTLKTRIRHLGPVNALALESFEEEKERLDFMRTQLTDLEEAESTLMATIVEINTTASLRFDETFTAIRENFQRLFVELFGEDASADIELQDDSDPLESDVTIMAKPKGKKPSVLAQLSGGEKTLTAIALLFSIYLVKPSPFCILDEVDAPLDDANVDRFMHLIRTFSSTTQFILVTHNKRTMEAADRMYGITMQEQGVSKLVGVKFEEEEEDDDLSAVA